MLFWSLAALLAAIGIGFLVRPLVTGAPAVPLDRRSATLAAHRARLSEIEGPDGDAPEESDAGREAREDIARALLRDLDVEDSNRVETPDLRRGRPRHRAAVLLGAALPALALALYALLGEPGALHPPSGPSADRTAAAIGAEVERLLDEAETIARFSGNRLEGEPARLVERALLLAPDHRKALWFSAIAALHEDRAEDARGRLERLRSLGPMDEDERGMYDRLMAEAAARLPGS